MLLTAFVEAFNTLEGEHTTNIAASASMALTRWLDEHELPSASVTDVMRAFVTSLQPQQPPQQQPHQLQQQTLSLQPLAPEVQVTPLLEPLTPTKSASLKRTLFSGYGRVASMHTLPTTLGFTSAPILSTNTRELLSAFSVNLNFSL
jgi:hypothetical protein